jgi:phosphohistidine phosphatase
MLDCEIFLMRHGKAESTSESGRDIDRRLNDRGWRESGLVGAQLITYLAGEPLQILLSPSVRTQESLNAMKLVRQQTITDKALYLADAEVYRDAVVRAARKHPRVLLIAHNPGLRDLTGNWSAHANAAPENRALATARFATAWIAHFRMSADDCNRPSEFFGFFRPELP